MFWTYVYLPLIFAGRSTRGTVLPTILYSETFFAGDWPTCNVAGFIVTLKTLPPSRSPYFTVLPLPLTTPLSTVSEEAGTPSCVEASWRSFARAATAAARTGSARDAIPPEPPPPPPPFIHVSGVG